MENSYAEGIAVGIENAVGVAILRRRPFYADGQLRALSGTWPTLTVPTFGRRRRSWPSASFTIPVVTDRALIHVQLLNQPPRLTSFVARANVGLFARFRFSTVAWV
jgi:hypothetical protein